MPGTKKLIVVMLLSRFKSGYIMKTGCSVGYFSAINTIIPYLLPNLYTQPPCR
jgi:hypothetical protein